MTSKGFPKYFLVDFEIYVKVYIEKDVLMAINDLGSRSKPYRAMINGREITKAEFEAGSIKRRKEFP